MLVLAGRLEKINRRSVHDQHIGRCRRQTATARTTIAFLCFGKETKKLVVNKNPGRADSKRTRRMINYLSRHNDQFVDSIRLSRLSLDERPDDTQTSECECRQLRHQFDWARPLRCVGLMIRRKKRKLR